MKRSIALSLITLIVALTNAGIAPVRAFKQESLPGHALARADFSLPDAQEAGKFMLYEQNGKVACREATAEEADMFQRDSGIALHPISHTDPYLLSGGEPGLKIVLRATQQ